jgi:hypothetical protein
MAHPYARLILFTMAGDATLVGPHHELKVAYSRTIDQPAPELPTDIEVSEDEQQDLNSILAAIKLPSPIPPAPNVLAPSIWSHPNTITHPANHGIRP